MTNTLGIYIHIPFCASRCFYCDFYSTEENDLEAPRGEELKKLYQKALIAHLKETARFCTKHTVDSVYFGGGTPTFYGYKRLCELLGVIKRLFNISSLPEITFEANPESTDIKSAKKLYKAGFNRVSLGIQSFDPQILKTIGRIHTPERAAEAIEIYKKAGFNNISGDLILGLPGQTTEGLLKDISMLTALGPQHVSCYGLKLGEDSPLYRSPALPDDDTQADMYERAVDLLERLGYMQYEISNFSLPSRQSRHNMKYWTLEPYLGFGPSAHSDFGGRRYSYIKSLRRYIEGIMTGEEIIDEYEDIKNSERAGEYLMLRLRTTRGISSNEYVRLFGASFDRIEDILGQYEKTGYARREGEFWSLTTKGLLISNTLIGEIMDKASSPEY